MIFDTFWSFLEIKTHILSDFFLHVAETTVFHLCHYMYIWKINWTFLGLPFRNGISISKSNFDFKMELWFQNGDSISKSSLDFKVDLWFQMELWFWNQASISKWSFNFEIELRCRNEASMSKSSFDFQIEVRFQNKASISKWCFDFEIKLQFKNRALIWKWSFNFVMELRFENQPSTSKWSFGFEMKPRFQNGWNLDFKMELNPCMEIIIQKINFLKNENCSCSFFKFWNMDLNFTFRFFEMRSLISIWVSTKIETKF